MAQGPSGIWTPLTQRAESLELKIEKYAYSNQMNIFFTISFSFVLKLFMYKKLF